MVIAGSSAVSFLVFFPFFLCPWSYPGYTEAYLPSFPGHKSPVWFPPPTAVGQQHGERLGPPAQATARTWRMSLTPREDGCAITELISIFIYTGQAFLSSTTIILSHSLTPIASHMKALHIGSTPLTEASENKRQGDPPYLLVFSDRLGLVEGSHDFFQLHGHGGLALFSPGACCACHQDEDVAIAGCLVFERLKTGLSCLSLLLLRQRVARTATNGQLRLGRSATAMERPDKEIPTLG
ncbi:hypothetical protein B0T18DRAFT_214700 [Schizothecium vesticola]|uniref:Uncharacterized protein n=1 Tax=Schizothecium vesticola TaxID=314040 RepID=A0AA40JZG0_9PEZI|nr:hypothetical protein B0T18DRAFT_214700 [Schizothecium vesticola]